MKGWVGNTIGKTVRRKIGASKSNFAGSVVCRARNISRGTNPNSVHKKHFSLRRDAALRVIRRERERGERDREREFYIRMRIYAMRGLRHDFSANASNDQSIIIFDQV